MQKNRLSLSLFTVPLISVFVSSFVRADYGMNTIDPSYKPNKEETVSLSLPPTQSQDTLGICFSMAGSLLMDTEMCRGNDGNLDGCKDMKNDARISPIDSSRFANDDTGNGTGDRHLYPGIVESGAISYFLHTAVRARYFSSEGCASLDQIVNRNSDPAKAMEIEKSLWERMKMLYEKSKRESCPSCDMATMTAIDKVRENTNIKANNQQILKALAEDSYSKFLDKLLIPEACLQDDFEKGIFNTIEFNKVVDVVDYPQEDLPKKKKPYDTMLSKIKEVLKSKTPIGITFCSQPKFTAKNRRECGGALKMGDVSSSVAGTLHSVVIKGYRRVCKTKSDCYDAVQIQNSWGQTWQDRNDDGWVDAKELLDRTFYAKNSLVWLERPKD